MATTIVKKQAVKLFDRKRLEKGMSSERIQAPAKQMTAKEIEAFIIRHAS
ncbi:hypothetical protein P5E67_00845 [Vibrio parahaemolyticus]|nr:hypothetical protein [Vibrio parahaemolyticus]MDG3394313.1 hypothetical protein [Vibrio parahaemolyticus]